jgi:hypothetical protein
MSSETEIRPFRAEFSDEEIADLRRRIAATRWPERETVTDDSQGVRLALMQELAGYWGTDYDWRRCEANPLALIVSREIDPVALIATNGVWASSGWDRICRAAARPSMTGMAMSIRTRSGGSASAARTPAAPSGATRHELEFQVPYSILSRSSRSLMIESRCLPDD